MLPILQISYNLNYKSQVENFEIPRRYKEDMNNVKKVLPKISYREKFIERVTLFHLEVGTLDSETDEVENDPVPTTSNG